MGNYFLVISILHTYNEMNENNIKFMHKNEIKTNKFV